jgi:hypothetical protein
LVGVFSPWRGDYLPFFALDLPFVVFFETGFLAVAMVTSFRG